MEYEIKLKRKGEPAIIITVEGTKMSMNDGAILFNSARTFSVIPAIINIMKNEGLEWIKVDKK